MLTLEDRQREVDEGWQQREAREIDRLLAAVDWSDEGGGKLPPPRKPALPFPRQSFTVTIHALINGAKHSRRLSVLAKDLDHAEWLALAAVWEGATLKYT